MVPRVQRVFCVGENVRVISQEKPFYEAEGIISLVEQQPWQIAPYYFYHVALSCGIIRYEYKDLERLPPQSRSEERRGG